MLTIWKPAVIWGVSAALIHRVSLTIWMNIAWYFLGSSYASGPHIIHDNPLMPSLNTALEQHLFGIWRRWDAMHYIVLSQKGYQLEIEGSTVFGALTPVGLRFFDMILPGPLDLGAAIFETLMFALALTVLYRLVETYYQDAALAPWAVIVLVLTPLSFYFAAPMSESPYLAMAVTAFYFASHHRWGTAAVCAFLATLTRSQGIVLLPVLGLMLLEYEWRTSQVVRITFANAVRKGWVLVFIPFAFFGFETYRSSIGLRPISEIYATVTQNRLVFPVEGVLINLGVLVRDVRAGVFNINPPWLVATLVLAAMAFRFPKHRRLALQAYTLSHLFLFTSFINYVWDTDEIMGTQSIARYSLVLFPLTVLIADGVRHSPRLIRVVTLGGLALGLLLFSGLFTVGLVGP